MKFRSVILATCYFAASCVMADEYDDAVRSYASGEYKKAYQLFLPLAESGDADAQFHLGLMYDNGLGVEKDSATAEKWYNRACPLPDETASPK